jgi:O-antigen/teichoic acid export membrane protein
VTLGVVVYRTLPQAHTALGFSSDALRSLGAFAGGALAITFLGFALSQTDKLVLSGILTLGAFGLYSLAYAVASSVRLLAMPIDQAVYPRLTELIERGDAAALASLYHAAAQYTAVLVGGVGCFIAIFGYDVVRLWTQDAELAATASAVLALLALGAVLNAVMNSPHYLQLASGWTSLLVKTNAAMVIVFVPATYVLAVQFGMMGAAIAWVLVNLTYVLLVAGLMHKRLLVGHLREWYVDDLARPMLAGATACATIRLLIPVPQATASAIAVLGFALFATLAASGLAASRVRASVGLQVRLAVERAR